MKYYNGNTIRTRSGAWRSKAQLNAISREYSRKAETGRLAEIDRLGLAKLWKAQTVYKSSVAFLAAIRKAATSKTCGNNMVYGVWQAKHYYNYDIFAMRKNIVEPLEDATGGIYTSYSLHYAMLGALNYNY